MRQQITCTRAAVPSRDAGASNSGCKCSNSTVAEFLRMQNKRQTIAKDRCVIGDDRQDPMRHNPKVGFFETVL